MNLPVPLRGIVAAPFLPMLPDESIDWPTVASYIDWVAAQRPVARTLAPSATKISTVRRPMPLVAPVTMVILPSSLPMDISPFSRPG